MTYVTDRELPMMSGTNDFGALIHCFWLDCSSKIESPTYIKENKKEGNKEETKEEKKGEEKKEENKEEQQEIVLKVDMHCEASARKVAKALKGFEDYSSSGSQSASFQLLERFPSFPFWMMPSARLVVVTMTGLAAKCLTYDKVVGQFVDLFTLRV